MMNQQRLKKRTVSSGAAAVEFVIVLPLLILLLFPVIDVARAIQANTILTNIAREGANLASRTLEQEQVIMDSLAATAPPLNMSKYGTMRITRIMGRREGNGVRNVVVAQYRWNKGTYTPSNHMWECGDNGSRWNGGSCVGIPTLAAAPSANIMSGMLAAGDAVYLVEVFYKFPLFFGIMDLGFGASTRGIGPDLYAMTIF